MCLFLGITPAVIEDDRQWKRLVADVRAHTKELRENAAAGKGGVFQDIFGFEDPDADYVTEDVDEIEPEQQQQQRKPDKQWQWQR